MKLAIKRRRRRDYRVGRLAEDLGISGRTIKRCLNRHPQLAVSLRATRFKGEWRFDYPKSKGEYQAYLSEAQTALGSLSDGRLSRQQERVHREVWEYIAENYGDCPNGERAKLIEAIENAQTGDQRQKAPRAA